MKKTYYNIPVDDEETYIAVKVIAKNNGFGDRGMGQQIKAWVDQTMAAPACDHPKTRVQVQRSANETSLTGMIQSELALEYTGWYCSTCNRVYPDPQRVATQQNLVAAETAQDNIADPYGQPATVKTRKRKTQRVGRDK